MTTKIILLSILLFCAIVLPSLCQTPQNSVDTDIAVIKTEIKNLNANIDDKFEGLEKHLDKRFESIEKNFDRQNNLIIACIAIPMALIAILVTWRSIRDNSLQKQIDALSEVVESQKQQLKEKPQS